MSNPTTARNAPAYEHNGQRISRERFYAIACDPRRSVAVEACAGAGKTWMLVSRILRALLAGARPHEILAITFTKKAAGEMRQRLHEWLADFAQASPEALAQALVARGVMPQPSAHEVQALKNLYPGLLAAGRPAQVRTFHSWFAALLRNAPLAVLEQLGLPAHYELLEDDGQAIAMVWRRFHSAVAAEPAARADFEASVAMHGRSQTQKALLAALAKRVEFALADAHDVVQASIKTLAEQYPEFAGLEEPGEMLQGEVPRQLFIDAARSLGRAQARTFAAKGAELELALAAGDLRCVFEALLTQQGEPRKFSEKIEGLARVRAAQELAQHMARAAAQHEAWLHHQRMARLARLLIAQFAALKRERGWVDMNDVERAALVMLSDPVLSGWVQERLDARVKHLLIDEFQDTNPLQWQALHAWLSGYAGAGGDAPSVFIVGDPKQSIYRFRRAEPQVFRAAQSFVVEALAGDLLSCDHTHRNAGAVIGVVNEVMAAAQAAGQYEGFRPHTTESGEPGGVANLPQIPRADPPRAGRGGRGGAAQPLEWRDSLATPRELPEEKLITLECRQAAAWIARQIESGAAPGHIMVLARKRDRLAVMEEELRALHIPAQQPEKTDLCEMPEVQDIAALLDALVSPAHDLSLARALKSPLFEVDDQALVALALAAREAREAGRPVPWFELLGKQDLPPQLRAISITLLRWKGWVESLPPHDALENIYHDGEVLARFAAAAPAPLREGVLAHLRALLGAALQVDGARYATPYGFVRALKAGGIGAAPPSDAQAVRLLTVHGAKGLEAPIVLMLDSDCAPARAETMGVVVEWPGQAPAPWRFAFIASETRPPPCSAEALEVERAARQREELNALYVAMTRARSRLVLSSVQPHAPGEPSWWQRLLPLCAALEPAQGVIAAPQAVRSAERFMMRELPPVTNVTPSDVLNPVAKPLPDSDESRFGQALHRLLEAWTGGARDFAHSHVMRVAREFALSEAAAGEAAAMAQRILTGEGAWAWDPASVDWQANEVPLHHEGDLLRLDRLVRRTASGEWWVLDYKAAARPERQAELIAQLSRYRTAVRAACPGVPVRAAFLTGQGKLVMLE
ncbi:MAG TPA: UvrD-helicase domain-containing protein [Ramlibacter sp.]|nr:UvrD-helicase domain-containing protein [Ramlibacter sp.]